MAEFFLWDVEELTFLIMSGCENVFGEREKLSVFRKILSMLEQNLYIIFRYKVS